jgi:hypothetical protein
MLTSMLHTRPEKRHLFRRLGDPLGLDRTRRQPVVHRLDQEVVAADHLAEAGAEHLTGVAGRNPR